MGLYLGSKPINILAAGTEVIPSPLPKVVTWASGTDEEIVAMVQAADEGLINLADYWAVGDERQVSLPDMPANYVGEYHESQTVTLVLSNAGGKTLADGKTCSFQVDQKNCLYDAGYMNPVHTNAGGWRDSQRRTWCNSVYKNAMPSTIREIFKPFINKSGTGSASTSGTEETTDYFALRAEVEIYGRAIYSVSGEGTQVDYYKISANRVKKWHDSSPEYYWWMRSPTSGNSTHFGVVSINSSATRDGAAGVRGFAPFGCI